MPATPWDAYNLPAIWTMLRHESTCDGVDRILDWDGLAHDVRTQHRRLKEAQAELAAAWPPEKNESARVFLDRIDILTASMDQTLRRAEDTRAGLRGIIEAIAEAQTTIKPLVDQRLEVGDDLIPRWADHAEDEYDAKAREAMTKAEAAIADYSSQIQAPTLYRAFDDDDETGSDIPGTQAQGGAPKPVAVPHDPPPPSTVAAPPATGVGPVTGVTPGPSLAGVIAPPPPAPVPVPAAAPDFVAAPAAGSGPLGPGVTPFVPFPLQSGTRSTASGRQPVPIRTALPSGAVIGATGTPARTGTTTGPATPHPPVRPGPATPQTAGRPGPTTSQTPGRPSSSAPQTPGRPSPSAPHSKRPEDRKPPGEEPADERNVDQTWDVREGVAPVIRPRRRRHHHGPGAGVIGIDR
jgi:hypothetical protein